MTGHFISRVHERIGPDASPALIWRNVRDAIQAGRSDYVEDLHRQDKDGKRLFRFRYRDGREFVIAVNTDRMIPITIMDAE
jgi:hypothetical protein